MTDILQQDIMYLTGVGPNRKKILSAELGIETFGDLLEYYPYKYVDRSKIYKVSELTGDMPFVQVVGHILSFESFDMGPRKERVVAHFSDGTGIMDLVWFNGGKYAKENYKIGKDYLVFGRPSVYNNRIQVQHPEMEPTPNSSPREGSVDSLSAGNSDGEANQTPLPWGGAGGGFRPYYNTTEKMKKFNLTSRAMERLTRNLIEKLRSRCRRPSLTLSHIRRDLPSPS